MKKIANFFIFTSNNLYIRYFYKYLRETAVYNLATNLLHWNYNNFAVKLQ